MDAENAMDKNKWRPAILCVIITDGHENASQEFSLETIKKLISEKEEQGNWTFVYLGADLEAWSGMGFHAGNVAQYDLSNVKGAYESLKCKTVSHSVNAARGIMSSQNFIGDIDKDEALVGRGMDLDSVSEAKTDIGESND